MTSSHVVALLWFCPTYDIFVMHSTVRSPPSSFFHLFVFIQGFGHPSLRFSIYLSLLDLSCVSHITANGRGFFTTSKQYSLRTPFRKKYSYAVFFRSSMTYARHICNAFNRSLTPRFIFPCICLYSMVRSPLRFSLYLPILDLSCVSHIAPNGLIRSSQGVPHRCIQRRTKSFLFFYFYFFTTSKQYSLRTPFRKKYSYAVFVDPHRRLRTSLPCCGFARTD